jgi:hypothetical protein
MRFKKGDLVRYVANPLSSAPRIIPKGSGPIGIVINTREFRVGDKTDVDTQAIMKIVSVHWSDITWNESNGLSEEYEPDLKIIQASEK